MRSADLIVAARRSAGLSQGQLAARLGRGESTITHWEAGDEQPSFETLLGVVHACGRDLTVGLARYDDSYDSLIAQQQLLDPRGRIEKLAPPWVAEGFDLLDLLAKLAGQARFVVVGAVAGALQSWPIILGWRILEIVAAPSSVGRIEQIAARLGAQPFAGDERRSRRSEEEQGSRAWIFASGGRLRVTLLPHGTFGYCDLARDAETMQIAPDTSVHVASLIDLIRVAECSTDAHARTFTPALWSTLEMQHRRREHDPRQ